MPNAAFQLMSAQRVFSFDFDGTLFGHNPPFPIQVKSILATQGHEVTVSDIMNVMPRVHEHYGPEMHKMIKGYATLTDEEQHRAIVLDRTIAMSLLLGKDKEDVQTLAEHVVSVFRKHGDYTPYEGVPELLRRLHGCDSTAVVVLSGNSSTRITASLQRFGLLNSVDLIITPDLYSPRKRDNFPVIKEKLGVAPSATAHFGDDPDLDVLAPMGYGIHSAHISWPLGSPRFPIQFESPHDCFIGSFISLPEACDAAAERIGRATSQSTR